ncbi:MAG: hypothetical protein R3C49_13055 [Planctomycetaceae bacterium]
MTTHKQAFPSRADQFLEYLRNFVTQLGDHPEKYGVTPEDVQKLQADQARLDTTTAAANSARDAAKAAVETKDAAVAAAKEAVRLVTRRIQADPSVTDAARLAAGIPVHKNHRTPVPRPATAPVGSVIATERLEHQVMFSDSATPTRRARPFGATGCEIYVAVADHPPGDPQQYRFAGLCSRSPETIRFQPEDGGRLANYLLRWVNSKGEFGPWSQPISATIPAV